MIILMSADTSDQSAMPGIKIKFDSTDCSIKLFDKDWQIIGHAEISTDLASKILTTAAPVAKIFDQLFHAMTSDKNPAKTSICMPQHNTVQ